jgi:hypothetical protein
MLAVSLCARPAQAQATKLLPNDAEMVVTVNLQQILKSEVLTGNKAILEILKAKFNEQMEEKGVDKYFKKAGFDPLVDLSSVTVAIPGAGRNQAEVVVILEGKFDGEKIEAAATEANKEQGGAMKVIQLANTKVFELSPPNEKTIYIGVLSKKYMLATATKADFTEAVARMKGTKQSSLKPEVKSLLGVVNNKQSFSLVATGAALLKLSENAPQGAGGDGAKVAMAALDKLNGASIAITIAKNIDFEVGINTKDNQTATEFAGAVTAGVNIFKPNIAKQAKNDAKFAPALEVLESISAKAQGNNLMIRGQLSYETLGKILQNLPMQN